MTPSATQGAVRPSLFRTFLGLAGARVLPATLTRSTLLDVCRTLEDLIAAIDAPGVVLGGTAAPRWLEPDIASSAEPVDADTATVVPTPGLHDVTRVAVPVPGVQCDEWFRFVLTDAFSAVLFGRELQDADAADGGRRFVTVWSFDPGVVRDLMQALADEVQPADEDAARLITQAQDRFPPRVVAPPIQQRFINAMLERLDASHRRGPWLGASAVGLDGGDRPEPTHGDREPAPRGRILVVDDEPATRGLLEALLRRAGWDVAGADDEATAVAAIENGQVAAVMVDLDLNGSGGRRVIERLIVEQPALAGHTAYIADREADEDLDRHPLLSTPFTWQDVTTLLARIAVR